MKQKIINRWFLETIHRFLDPMLQNKYITFRASIYYFLWALWTIYHVYFIQKLVYFIENHDKENFINLIIIYAIFNVVFEILYYYTRTWWRVLTVNAYRRIIHRNYLKDFVKLWNIQTEKVWTWKMISILDKWMDTWSLQLDQLLLNAILVLVAFLFSLYTIVKVNIAYWVVFLIIYIFLHILWWYINNFTIKERRKRQEVWSLYTKQLVKIIMSKFEILQTSKINHEVDKLDDNCIELEKYSLKMSKYVQLFFRVPEWFLTWSKYLILLYLWLKIFDSKADFSTFVWVFWVFTVLDAAISKSMTFYKDFTHSFTSIEKLWDFFDTTPKIYGYNKWKEFDYKKWNIKIKNISFGYQDDKKIFEDFSLDILGGKITALVWNSWGWKTTLVKIISQYIKQDSWNLIIDWQYLSEVSLKSYYKSVWYLTQEPSVFDGTILDNLSYAIDWKVSQDKIDEIIKLSKCEFIYDFKDWLNTQIGERWIRLSWWQKQRLAIAKIMLKDPKIIILDEPTSALDSFSEELIIKAMNNLFKWRTVIVIAHRLQTVRHADIIHVLSEWKVIETWKHDELIKQKWVYKKMLDLQSGF